MSKFLLKKINFILCVNFQTTLGVPRAARFFWEGFLHAGTGSCADADLLPYEPLWPMPHVFLCNSRQTAQLCIGAWLTTLANASPTGNIDSPSLLLSFVVLQASATDGPLSSTDQVIWIVIGRASSSYHISMQACFCAKFEQSFAFWSKACLPVWSLVDDSHLGSQHICI